MNKHFTTGLFCVIVCATGCQHYQNASVNQNYSPYTPPIIAPVSTTPINDGVDLLAASHGAHLSNVRAEPILRIRLATISKQATIGQGNQILQAHIPNHPADTTPLTAPVNVTWDDDPQHMVIEDATGKLLHWRTGKIIFQNSQGIDVGTNHYPGAIEIMATRQPNQNHTLEIINLVPLETYLPGVLGKEMYHSWDIEAFRSQAIAARSYAIWEMSHSRIMGKHFDLEATVSSQAYAGSAAPQQAIEAVQSTYGKVLVWNQRILPAFFSAATGPRGQDSSAAFPTRGIAALPPISGALHPGIEAGTPRYQWGPFSRSANDLSARIAMWGGQNDHPVSALHHLDRVDVVEYSHTGRPAVFRIFDKNGLSWRLNCEDFRFACNTKTIGHPDLTRDNTLFSSDITIDKSGDSFTITGYGHGHGVGMSQWGAQELAKKGLRHPDILTEYYPGATLVEAYQSTRY